MHPVITEAALASEVITQLTIPAAIKVKLSDHDSDAKPSLNVENCKLHVSVNGETIKGVQNHCPLQLHAAVVLWLLPRGLTICSLVLIP